MADQNIPDASPQTPTVPPVAAPIPAEQAPPPPPSVVVPNSGGGIPSWFYFIFGVTLIVFFVVTTLLVLQLTQKPVPPTPVPTITPKVTSIQPTPTVAIDSAVTKLNEVASSDEISSIEADIKNTDLGVWDQGLTVVEAQISSSP